jgi:hypothetical protein
VTSPYNTIEPVHPAVADARELLRLEQTAAETKGNGWIWDLRKAILVSPTLDVCEALLRGEHVPRDRLDQDWLRRLSHRHR